MGSSSSFVITPEGLMDPFGDSILISTTLAWDWCYENDIASLNSSRIKFIAPLALLLIWVLYLPGTHGACISMEHLRNVVQDSTGVILLCEDQLCPKETWVAWLTSQNKHRGALRLAGKDASDATEVSIIHKEQVTCITCICAVVLLHCF